MTTWYKEYDYVFDLSILAYFIIINLNRIMEYHTYVMLYWLLCSCMQWW